MRQVDALSGLKKGLAPVYLVHGQDAFQAGEFLAALRSAALPPGTESMNEHILEPGPEQVRQGLLLARTPPFLSEKRIVVLKECGLLAARRGGGAGGGEGREAAEGDAGAGDDAGQGDSRLLLEYVDAPSPFTCLVLHAAGEVDRRRKLARRLLEKAVVVDCTPLAAHEAAEWAVARAAALGARLRRDAAEALVEKVGTDLHALRGEIEKLALYAGEGNDIDLAAVLAVVPGTAQVQVFDLVDAVAEGRIGEAEDILSRMLAGGEPPLRLVATLASHYRRLLEAQSLRSRGHTPAAIAREKGQHPRYWEKIDRQARRFRRAGLVAALEALLQADADLKTGASGDLVLETLLFHLARTG